ncbi:MAG: hypothetical protein GVY28_08585 [Alphaproteobacteria bacterium]|jgi:hypothetical protein|nr:hypothetical protein [Alphaproteobacteria bacterium]
MTATDRITYDVLTWADGRWHSQGEIADMQTALSAAEKLFASNRFPKVKVDKRFFDTAHGREVTATILERAVEQQKAKGGVPMAVWIALAALGGIASFAISYVLTSGALG